MINGIEYWVSAWTKKGAKGKFQSLSFKRKDEKQETKHETKKQDRSSFDDAADDIPW